jgi:hypothetical protein
MPAPGRLAIIAMAAMMMIARTINRNHPLRICPFCLFEGWAFGSFRGSAMTLLS